MDIIAISDDVSSFWALLREAHLKDAALRGAAAADKGARDPNFLMHAGATALAAERPDLASRLFACAFRERADAEALIFSGYAARALGAQSTARRLFDQAQLLNPKTMTQHVELRAVRRAPTEASLAEVRRTNADEITEPEMRLLPALCTPNRLGIDIGAAAGLFSYHIIANSGGCLAFEPRVESVNVSKSRYQFWDDVYRIELAALSNTNGISELRVPAKSIGWSTIEVANTLAAKQDEDIAVRRVPTIRLDSVALSDWGFGKIDVEGHEFSVLEGGACSVLAFRPNLLIESQNAHNHGVVRRIAMLLKQWGYVGGVLRSSRILPVDWNALPDDLDTLPYNLIFTPREQWLSFIEKAFGCLNDANKTAATPTPEATTPDCKPAPQPVVGYLVRAGKETFCAGVVARNEGSFLEASVESLVDVVDEVLIVENGSIDETVEVAQTLALKHSKVRLIRLPADTLLATARNTIDNETHCDWILWWDADFIAWSEQDSSKHSLAQLLSLVRKQSSYNQVLYGGPNTGPNFDLTMRAKPFQGTTGDTQITRKGFMRFEVKEYIDTRYYTEPQRTIYLNNPSQPFLLHLDKVKPLARMILRDLVYQFEVDAANSRRDDNTFRSWILSKHPNFSLNIAKDWLLKSMAEGVGPYDFTTYGAHPSILKPYIEKPFFESRLEDGKIVEVRQVRPFAGDAALDAYFARLGLA